MRTPRRLVGQFPSGDTAETEPSARPNRHDRVWGANTNPGRIPFGRGGSGVYTMNIEDGRREVNDFCYTDKILDDLEVCLSHERLSTYLAAADRDREMAVRLHIRNTAVSAAFYGPLQVLEVALRNAMNRRLGEVYGRAWYDNDQAGFDRLAMERVSRAKSLACQE